MSERLLSRLPLQRRLRQPIGLGVMFARNVRNGELQRTRQLAAGPVQRIETFAAAGIFAGHLPHYNLRIGENVQRSRILRDGVLQRFHQRGVFGDVVILSSNPFSDTFLRQDD